MAGFLAIGFGLPQPLQMKGIIRTDFDCGNKPGRRVHCGIDEPNTARIGIREWTETLRSRVKANPRWRICNRNTTHGILEGNYEFGGDRSTIALRPRFGPHHRRLADAARTGNNRLRWRVGSLPVHRFPD